MNATMTSNWKNHVHLIWVIAAKDIVDAIRNKNVIAIFLSSLFIIVMYRGLPLLERAEAPTVRIYADGESALVAFLENSPAVEVRTYASLEKVIEALGHSDLPELGLAIPAGFDQALESGQVLPLQGYVVSWANPAEAAELQQFFEAEVSRLLGQPVSIQMAGNIAYLTPESSGLGATAGMAISFSLIMIGITLIPHLMIEEKKAHTLETLLISPASALDVVSAKALAGLFYCLVGALVGLAVFSMLVVHWWLALLAVLLGAVFAVSLGLLLGTLVEDRAQLTMWAWVFILPMFLPLVISLLDDLMPGWVLVLTRWLPATVVFNLQRASFAHTFVWHTVLLGTAWLLACIATVLGVLAWVVRRQADDSLSLQDFAARLRRRAASDPQSVSSTASRPERPDDRPAAAPALPAVRDAGLALMSSHPDRRTGFQIIAAITAKDVRDAIRNKTLLSILLGVLLLAATSLLLPLLLGSLGKPLLVVYDSGDSLILKGLAAGETFRLRLVDSPEELYTVVSTAGEVALGLVLPEDFDGLGASPGPVVLDAYAAHWARAEKIAEMVSFFEQQLSQGSWSDVRIRVSAELLYPPLRAEGYLVTMNSTIVVVLMVVGIAMVPLLILEEKEARTLEALLVSPARLYQVMVGKAAAGMVYCLTAALTFLLLVNHLVAHWGLALLAILLGALLAVGLGILIGLLVDSPASVSLWGSLVLLLLLGTNMLQYFDMTDWPVWIRQILDAFPGVLIMRLLGLSESNQFLPGIFLSSTFSLLFYSMMVYLVNLWIMHRRDR